MKKNSALVAVLLLAMSAAFAVGSAAKTGRPNILHIHADDHRADGLRALGTAALQTPHLDTLVERGMTFLRCYTMGSMIGAVCLPSRTMMLTGRSLFRIGSRAAPAAGLTPLPALIKEAGYETWHMGKSGNEYKAGIEAFDTNLVDDAKGTGEQTGRAYSSRRHADRAIEFLKSRNPSKPFYIYLAPPVPHDPREAEPQFHALYAAAKLPLSPAFLPLHPWDNGDMTVRDEKLAPWPRTPEDTRRQLADYYACVTGLDYHVGRIFEALRQSGQFENTILVFTGDNGLSLGEHGLFGKQNLYEFGGMHVPCVLAGPGIPKGRSEALVYLMDLYPTFCDFAGATPPAGTEGRNLRPIIEGKSAKVRDALYTAYQHGQRAIRDDRWKLIRYPLVDKTQLFDLAADPRELNNLAEKPEYAAKVSELLTLLQKEMQRHDDTTPLQVADPKPAAWSPPPAAPATAREYHVSVAGDDSNDGSSAKPFRTISAAARVAQPGDVVTVHEGTYRERVTPPRGGESDEKRIVYQAAPGEKAVIKGSEVIRSWKPFMQEVWKVTIPNSFFGAYNPYKDLIAGDWFTDRGRPHHTGEVYLNGKSLWESHLLERVLDPQPATDAKDRDGSTYTWFAESDEKYTYIYANFHGKNPNQEEVEVNVRDSCFYPDQPGRDYITVRGFYMSQAATQWAAPTAEQIALVGTHWSKGWILENNVISDSKCSGISLGKDRKTGHNVWNSDPRKDGATHYNEVILRALEAGWSRETVGSHIVRNNVIFNCEQAGIVGSLGAIFSQITNNHIYNIWTKRQFTGAEMAGIKLHGAIDVVIRNNRIHHAGRGLWMDWMAQGTRITGNLLYENSTDDLFVEVNHGPFVVDNNLLLSPLNLRDWSQGGAYAHNLMTGRILSRPESRRSTPYHKAHSTAIAGLDSIAGGDARFYNNIIVGSGGPPAGGTEVDANPLRYGGDGLWVYNHRESPLQTGGNVYLKGARAYSEEAGALHLPDADPQVEIVEEGNRVYLCLNLSGEMRKVVTRSVNTEMLGKTKISGLPFENADGSPLVVDTDYWGRKRNATAPSAGPFEDPGQGVLKLKIW